MWFQRTWDMLDTPQYHIFTDYCKAIDFHHLFNHFLFFVKLFKHPLEKEGQVGGPILAQEEIKTIFGCIPDIYDIHTRIKVWLWQQHGYVFVLPQIESVKDFLFLLNKTDLEDLLSDWSEDASVGNIILKYVSLIITCFSMERI